MPVLGVPPTSSEERVLLYSVAAKAKYLLVEMKDSFVANQATPICAEIQPNGPLSKFI